MRSLTTPSTSLVRQVMKLFMQEFALYSKSPSFLLMFSNSALSVPRTLNHLFSYMRFAFVLTCGFRGDQWLIKSRASFCTCRTFAWPLTRLIGTLSSINDDLWGCLELIITLHVDFFFSQIALGHIVVGALRPLLFENPSFRTESWIIYHLNSKRSWTMDNSDGISRLANPALLLPQTMVSLGLRYSKVCSGWCSVHGRFNLRYEMLMSDVMSSWCYLFIR